MDIIYQECMPSLLVFEDDRDEAKDVCTEVKKRYRKAVCGYADSLEKLRSLSSRRPFDVYSIDLNFNGIWQGISALSYLKREDPLFSSLVYTAYGQRRKIATKNGADLFVVKEGNLEPYLKTFAVGLRLGLWRQLRAASRTEEGYESPSSSHRSVYQDESSWQSFEKSYGRKTVAQVRKRTMACEDRGYLKSVLKRMGWWAILDAEEYAKSSRGAKLSALLKWLKTGTASLSKILSISNDVAADVLDKDYSQVLMDSRARERADILLSLLAYLLRLSDYDPVILTHFWTAKATFQATFQKTSQEPPWDAVGMCSYLETNNAKGLRTCLAWVRRSY